MLLDPGLPPSFIFALANEMDTLFLTIISRPSEGREGGDPLGTHSSIGHLSLSSPLFGTIRRGGFLQRFGDRVTGIASRDPSAFRGSNGCRSKQTLGT